MKYLLYLFAGLVLVQSTPSTSQESIAKINTFLISLPVSVKDQSGKYIYNLNKEDFALYENGVLQRIEHFATFETPVSVVLLLDTSGSTRERLGEIKNSAIQFIDQIGADSQIYPLTFDNRVNSLTEGWTKDRETLSSAVGRIQTSEDRLKLRRPDPTPGRREVYYLNTRLYDAISSGLDITQPVKGRKAIILFTDGIDNASRETAPGAMKLCEEADTMIYAIHYSSERVMIQSTEAYWAGKYLQKLGQQSGGGYHLAGTADQIRNAFQKIAEELRHQYSLGYYPVSEPGQKRKISVTVRRSNAFVKVREGVILPRLSKGK